MPLPWTVHPNNQNNESSSASEFHPTPTNHETWTTTTTQHPVWDSQQPPHYPHPQQQQPLQQQQQQPLYYVPSQPLVSYHPHTNHPTMMVASAAPLHYPLSHHTQPHQIQQHPYPPQQQQHQPYAQPYPPPPPRQPEGGLYPYARPPSPPRYAPLPPPPPPPPPRGMSPYITTHTVMEEAHQYPTQSQSLKGAPPTTLQDVTCASAMSALSHLEQQWSSPSSRATTTKMAPQNTPPAKKNRRNTYGKRSLKQRQLRQGKKDPEPAHVFSIFTPPPQDHIMPKKYTDPPHTNTTPLQDDSQSPQDVVCMDPSTKMTTATITTAPVTDNTRSSSSSKLPETERTMEEELWIANNASPQEQETSNNTGIHTNSIYIMHRNNHDHSSLDHNTKLPPQVMLNDANDDTDKSNNNDTQEVDDMDISSSSSGEKANHLISVMEDEGNDGHDDDDMDGVPFLEDGAPGTTNIPVIPERIMDHPTNILSSSTTEAANNAIMMVQEKKRRLVRAMRRVALEKAKAQLLAAKKEREQLFHPDHGLENEKDVKIHDKMDRPAVVVQKWDDYTQPSIVALEDITALSRNSQLVISNISGHASSLSSYPENMIRFLPEPPSSPVVHHDDDDDDAVEKERSSSVRYTPILAAKKKASMELNLNVLKLRLQLKRKKLERLRDDAISPKQMAKEDDNNNQESSSVVAQDRLEESDSAVLDSDSSRAMSNKSPMTTTNSDEEDAPCTGIVPKEKQESTLSSQIELLKKRQRTLLAQKRLREQGQQTNVKKQKIHDEPNHDAGMTHDRYNSESPEESVEENESALDSSPTVLLKESLVTTSDEEEASPIPLLEDEQESMLSQIQVLKKRQQKLLAERKLREEGQTNVKKKTLNELQQQNDNNTNPGSSPDDESESQESPMAGLGESIKEVSSNVSKIQELRKRQRELKQNMEINNLNNLIERQREMLSQQRQKLGSGEELVAQCDLEIKEAGIDLKASQEGVQDLQRRKRIIEGMVLKTTRQMMGARTKRLATERAKLLRDTSTTTTTTTTMTNTVEKGPERDTSSNLRATRSRRGAKAADFF